MSILKIRDENGNIIEIPVLKGDKGENGKDAITDQTYNPKSENAQSGKAVAEATKSIQEQIDKNRTHWAEEKTVEILPETTMKVVEEMEAALCPSLLPLVMGKTYTVVWNGTPYDCVPWVPSEGFDGILYLGNGGAMAEGLPNNGEPFVIAAAESAYVVEQQFGGEGGAVIYPLDGSTSITVSISCKDEIVHKLDNKYLDSALKISYVPIMPETVLSCGDGTHFVGTNALTEDMIKSYNALKVVYDGVEYFCDFFVLPANNLYTCGNMLLWVTLAHELVGGDGSYVATEPLNTGEPFFITFGDIESYIFLDKPTATIAIYGQKIEGEFANKQDKLIAGPGIFIAPNGKTISVAIDQTYNPESYNAQSGIAVAEVVAPFEYLKKNDNGYTFFEGIIASGIIASENQIQSNNFIGYCDDPTSERSIVNKRYVEEQIGDIETALENIIAKYGLGGETV